MENTPNHPGRIEEFSTATWCRISGLIALTFRFPGEEHVRFLNSKTARLIAAIPHLAGCGQPQRTALAHLATYVLSCKEGTRLVFDHCPEDDRTVSSRLAAIGHFEGGDANITARGMKLLAIQMICGYGRDLATDAVTHDYNPLLSLAWDGIELVESLAADIAAVECPGMDQIMSVAEAKRERWDYTWYPFR